MDPTEELDALIEESQPEASTHWNYRVTKRLINSPDEYVFEIREVYYGPGDKLAWTENPVGPSGETLEELETDIGHMVQALFLPVLDLETRRWLPLEPIQQEEALRRQNATHRRPTESSNR